ncbi:hypothetical protein CEXT_111 [Caerostris extrusa]|uniref:Uncharacterized protein n=1 Tax=Caerostris extrusa TaxID=172846 RepID=A0AAV4WPA1_CAEEX|nr:hypothetical protein CEXT_111 [Caerostris extrusa]
MCSLMAGQRASFGQTERNNAIMGNKLILRKICVNILSGGVQAKIFTPPRLRRMKENVAAARGEREAKILHHLDFEEGQRMLLQQGREGIKDYPSQLLSTGLLQPGFID